MTQKAEGVFVPGCSLILNDKIEYTIDMIEEQLHDLISTVYINNIKSWITQGTLDLKDIWYIEIVTQPRI